MLIRLLAKLKRRVRLRGMDARGFPTSLPEFQRVFPNDSACADYLEKLRWPDGFACTKCGTMGEPYRFSERKSTVLRCRSCQANVSLTAGTTMQSTHTPLSTWFWGAYLVTTQTPGQSALQFQRQLGLTRYETAYMILQKLRAGMVRPDRDTIGGEHPVEVDETLVGGRTRGEGRGVHHKTLVIGAVEVRTRKPKEDRSAEGNEAHKGGKPTKRQTYAGRLRMAVVPDRSGESLTGFIGRNIVKGTLIRTDGWQGYDGVFDMGYSHHPVVMDTPEKNDEHLPISHLIFSNFKTWLLGTHHAVSEKHLPAYINEYVFRFNRRFYPMTAFNSVLGLAAHATPPTYAEIYSDEWEHPAA